ncbi:MAG: hypothetical protein KIS92_11900 [Planctomycetota bacterium]|nr:hypothetical protein [Planctomycetota bacterium]
MTALLFLSFLSATLWAGPEEEARQLKDEANSVLQKGSGITLDPKDYAQCVVKLEKALDLLDKAGKSDTDLAVEVNTALYWARKFTTSTIINEIQKERGTGGTGGGGTGGGDTGAKPEPPKPPVKPPEPAKKEEPADDGTMSMANQKKLFEEAQKFASQHASDEYAVALRWFKAADELAGTEYAVKALALARESQERFAKKQGTLKEELPDNPAMALVKQGDAEIAAGRFDAGIDFYKKSNATEQTIVATRRLAHAHFDYAQKMKDALMPKFETADAEYRRAWQAATQERRTLGGQSYRRTNWNDPALKAAVAKVKALQAEAKDALNQYTTAGNYFRSVLNMAPKGQDLDAAGHYALCYSVRRADLYARNDAKRMLSQFLEDYKPANDLERTLYEFCRSELKELNKPPQKQQ